MAVRFTSRINEWVSKTEVKLDKAVFQMATDIDRVAKMNAPKASRALVNSAMIEKKNNASYSVRFGGGKVPYALRRHYENKKNPQTLKYLERAGDDTSRNVKRYLKDL